MRDHAADRDADVGLEVLVVVPAEGRHAVAVAEPELVPERRSQLSRAGREVGVRVPVPAPVGEARDDLPVAEELLAAPQDRRHVELVVHDQAFHVSLLAVSGDYAVAFQERRRDLGPQARARRREALDPERALVQPVENVLPGEADAAVHLDRGLADLDGRLAGERLRRRSCDRRLLVLLGDAPRRPERERARELEARVGVRERMGHRLVDADPLPELLAAGGVLDRVLERAPRDAAGLDRERRERPVPDLLEDVGVREPAPGLAAADDSQRPGLVGRLEDLALGAFELVDPVAADDRDAVGGVEIGDERPERERPARLAGGDLRLQLGREGGEDDADRREVRPLVQRAAELLEQHRLLDEAEPDAAVLLRDRDARPAELGQVLPRRLRVLREIRAGLLAKRLLLGCEGEVHQRDFGRPSTRSATMLRSTSEVPASIVFPRLRSCWYCQ